jgi:hypothetical protein
MSHNLQVDEFKENHSEEKTHCSLGDETANAKNSPSGLDRGQGFSGDLGVPANTKLTDRTREIFGRHKLNYVLGA